MEALHLQVPQGKILVAVSGGADSVALLRALYEQCSSIEVLHCNFQLRGKESYRDEDFVKRLCNGLGIAFHVKHFDTREYAAEQGISIEMAARELRYDWFEKMCKQRSADYIAVAHHREDQAETVLLNLIRGTGLRGLSGMHAVNGKIIRPLLSYSKDDIIQYLQAIGQEFVTDSTNLERDALRNRLRLDVIPLLKQLNPHAIEHIAQAAARVEDALPYYYKGVELSDTTTSTTLHEQLKGCGFNASQERKILEGLDKVSGAIFESQTHRALCNRGSLILQVKEEHKPTLPTLNFKIVEVDDALSFLRRQNLSPNYAYLDADKVSLPLTFRHPQQGDRFQPYGMNGQSTLVSDFLTDRKLSRFQKEQQWLVCSGSTIAWVVGIRSCHQFQITETTKRILMLTIKEL